MDVSHDGGEEVLESMDKMKEHWGRVFINNYGTIHVLSWFHSYLCLGIGLSKWVENVGSEQRL